MRGTVLRIMTAPNLEHSKFEMQEARMTADHAHLHDEEYQRRVKIFKKYLEGLTIKYFQVRPATRDEEVDMALKYFLSVKTKQELGKSSKKVQQS